MATKKGQLRVASPDLEERAAAAQIESNNGEYGGHAEQVPRRNGGISRVARKTKARWRPRSHRELGNAIFEAADPVKAGKELLHPGEERADPTRLNSLKAFAAWAFGSPDGEGQRKPPRIIWDIPGPPYEPVDPLAGDMEKSGGDDE
jgi:hypothetical protein